MDIMYADDDRMLAWIKLHAAFNHLGAIDIETTWLEDNPWKDKPELICTAITFDGETAFVFRGAEELELVRDILERNPFIMHNGLFDRLILKEFFDFDVELKHDTMAMQYLLDPDRPKSLEILSEDYLGLPPYKDVDYKNILTEPFEKVAQMNAEDVCRTYNLFDPLKEQINADPDLSRVYQWILMPAVNTLIDITQNGIPLDKDKLEDLTEETTAEVALLLSKLEDATPIPDPEYYEKGWPKPAYWRVKTHGAYDGHIFNPGSWKQVAHILFDLWDLEPLEWNTDADGNRTTPSTNADVLLRLETHHTTGKKQEWLHQLRSYRKATKLLTYFTSWPNLVDDSGWLHPRYKPLHTVTGRLSSQGPNIQNVPRLKEVRSCFGNADGYVWMKADYSQIELRLAALAAGETTMLEAYRNGDDLHRLTAKLILGDDSDKARQVGKVLNFGLLYGAGPATLQRIARSEYGVFFTLPEAKTYKHNFFEAYPNLKRWHKQCEREICGSGVSRSPLGRVRYLPKARIPSYVDDMWAKKMAAVREGINHRVQSFASDILLVSMNRVAAQLVTHEAKIVAEVHDEIDLLVPESFVRSVAYMVKTTMEDTSWLNKHGISLGVPMLATIETGNSWGELKEYQQ